MNMVSSPRVGWLLATLALGAATGCASSHAADATGTPRSVAAQADERGFIAAPGKPGGSGVVVRYRAPVGIKFGDTGTVQLEFANVVAATGAQVELRGSNPQVQVQINGAVPSAPLPLASGQANALEVQVTSAVEGLQYLNVFTRQSGRSSAITIPLRFGNGQVRLNKANDNGVTVTPSGERIISLPSN